MTIQEARKAWEAWLAETGHNDFASDSDERRVAYAKGVVDGLIVAEKFQDDPQFVLKSYRSKYMPQETDK